MTLSLVTLNPDGQGMAKVIDFGVAKATNQKLTEKTLFTSFATMIGTPAYMSPEQAEMSNLDVDTRADIYSLGVLLYELLTGTTPFPDKRLRSVSYHEMQRIILHEEPLRPSTRLNTLQGEQRSAVARNCGASDVTLGRGFPGDLDWIVMKCLEKDRARRYETASGLANDINRHLKNETIIARPPSALYRFQKFVHRHKLVAIAATVVALVLIAGVLVSAWQAARATRLRQLAQANERTALRAQAEEVKLRRQAQVHELAARQRAYASDINLAQQALANNNLGRALYLLNRQRPVSGQLDLRGWEWRFLWQQCRSDAAFTLCQRSNEIYSLALSQDGHWLALAEKDEPSLCIWDLRKRQEAARFPTGLNPQCDFSEQEPLLAYSKTTGMGTTNVHDDIVLWNFASRQKIGEFKLENTCTGISFAADGRSVGIAIGDPQNQTICVYRLTDLARVITRTGVKSCTAPFKGSAFSPDLGLFAYGDPTPGKGPLHLLDIPTGKKRWTVSAANEQVTALAFSPDGKTLASGEGYGASPIRFWNVATGERIGVVEGHSGWVTSLVFSPDGKTLVSGSSDQTIRLWDVSDPANPSLKRTLRGHRNEVWSLALLPDGLTLFSGAKDGALCAWDTSSEPMSSSHVVVPQKARYWKFDADGNLIAALPGESDYLISEWKRPDYLTAGAQWRHTQGVLAADVVPGGRLVAVLDTNGTLNTWDWRQSKKIREFPVGWVNSSFLGFLRNSNRLVTLNSNDGSVFAWDLDSGQKTSFGRVDLEEIRASGFGYRAYLSPHEQWVIFPQGKDHFLIKNLAANKERLLAYNLREPINEDWPSETCFSPDDKLFALASNLGYVRMWDVNSWREAATFRGFLQAPHSLAFSPDGHRIAVGGDAREAVKLFDTETHEELLNLTATGSQFGSIAFTDDGNVLGARDQNGEVNLWRAPSWAEITAAEHPEQSTSEPTDVRQTVRENDPASQ